MKGTCAGVLLWGLAAVASAGEGDGALSAYSRLCRQPPEHETACYRRIDQPDRSTVLWVPCDPAGNLPAFELYPARCSAFVPQPRPLRTSDFFSVD